MAGWSDWYSGAMAPPLTLPGGGYAPAPSSTAPMSVEDMYRGIYPSAPTGLTSRSVSTVPVPMSVSTGAGAGLGTGMRASGDVYYQAPKTFVPNTVPGPTPVAKSQDRLPALPAGLPLNVPTGATARGQLGAGGFGSGSLTASMPTAPAVIQLSSTPISDISGQNTANSFGKPVQYANGKTYYPSDTPMSGVRPPMKPVGTPPAIPGGQRQGGGLLSLFGNKGGILSTLFGGAAPLSFGTSTGSAISPGLGYNAAYSQTSTGDGQGNNAFSERDGRWGGARSLTE